MPLLYTWTLTKKIRLLKSTTIVRKELALFEFEMFSEIMISKESKEKAEKSLQKLRKEKWKKGICLAARSLVGAPAGCRGRNFAIFCV